MKKKVIKLTIDTELTNKQIEGAEFHVLIYHAPHTDPEDTRARSVRVLDSDTIREDDDAE